MAAHSLQEEIKEISQDDPCQLIGKLAVKYKLASVEQIKQALTQKEHKRQAGQDLFLGEIMVSQGIISQSQLDFLHSVQRLIKTREADNQFATIAVKNEFAAQEDIDQALLEQRKIFKASKTVKPLGDILVESGILKTEQQNAILTRQKQIEKGSGGKKINLKRLDIIEQMEIDATFELSVSQDRLGAFILPIGEVSDSISVENIKNHLLSKGIKYGLVDDRQIAEYLKNPDKHKAPWKIAEGQAPTPGQEARIKYYFETDPLKIGTIKEGAVFDFKVKADLVPVKKGALVAERIPAEAGEPGMDVYGRPIPAPEPNDKKFRPGKGTTVSKDGFKIFAGIDGVPGVSLQGKISVLSQHEISGDVGLKTGRVDFEGDIHVDGGIQNDYRVKGHSLSADEILKAQVDMAGDIVVAGGIIGSTINSGGNIRAIFVRGADIKALGDVIVKKGIRDSQIETSGACIIKGGTILSSTITAKKGIWAAQIGSDVSKPCILAVGVNDRVSNEIDKLTAFTLAKKAEIDKLNSLKQKLNQKSKDTENKIGKLAQLEDRAMVDQRKVQSEIEELKKADDNAQLASAETVLQDINTEIKAMEKNMEKLFALQDRISEKIGQGDQRITAAEIEIQEHEDRIAEITEWASNGDVIPEVRVNENIFPYTTIDGTNSSMALKQKYTHVLIKEHKSQASDNTPNWQMKISQLK